MSGTDSTLRLIELTSATLCHDISGLVGSLGDDADAPELEKTLVDVLTARLALRGAAWGPEGEPLTLARMRSLARGLPRQVVVEASAVERDTVFAASAGRIVLNLLLLAADSLPSGGAVMLAGSANDLFVRIAGPAAAWPAGMALCLANETEARFALNAWRAPQMALTALLAHAAGIRLSVLFSPTGQNDPAILRLGG
ncbi:MAG TPA: histidine phosphotransferase family protein, partial [Rhodopila sp.]